MRLFRDETKPSKHTASDHTYLLASDKSTMFVFTVELVRTPPISTNTVFTLSVSRTPSFESK